VSVKALTRRGGKQIGTKNGEEEEEKPHTEKHLMGSEFARTSYLRFGGCVPHSSIAAFQISEPERFALL
jgi:hypothetical protein